MYSDNKGNSGAKPHCAKQHCTEQSTIIINITVSLSDIKSLSLVEPSFCERYTALLPLNR